MSVRAAPFPGRPPGQNLHGVRAGRAEITERG